MALTMDDLTINVYATSDGGIAPWTNPWRVHLHKKTASGTTLCCPSVIAGGIVLGRSYNSVYFLTTDKIIPSSNGSSSSTKEQLLSHADTNNGTCECIGQLKRITHDLHSAIITISDTVANSDTIAKAKDNNHFFSSLIPTGACLHYAALKYQFRRADAAMPLLARTRYDEVIHGVMTDMPETQVRTTEAPPPWEQLKTGGLISAGFGGDAFPSRSRIDVGMWVYARRIDGGRSDDEATNKMLDARSVGPYRPDTFRYVPVGLRMDEDAPPRANRNALILVGHVVEVRGEDADATSDGSVSVKIQGLYDVLERIVVFGV